MWSSCQLLFTTNTSHVKRPGLLYNQYLTHPVSGGGVTLVSIQIQLLTQPHARNTVKIGTPGSSLLGLDEKYTSHTQERLGSENEMANRFLWKIIGKTKFL